ncbi:MAG: bifunctional metallophosphatase/5'-nucleotidase [Bacteroidota bacterium]
MSISRRNFVKSLTIGSAVALSGIPFLVSGKKDKFSKLTILHTNDTHSRLDPFPANHHRYPSMGGYARRSSLIDQIRANEEHVLLFDSGDIFQGTPYYNFFGGKPELELMSKMKYDASTIGNHEFDNGLEEFLKVMPYANFPFISSNYDFSDTVLKDRTISHKVFFKDNLKVGVYGLGVKPDGLISKNLFGDTKYIDPIEKAKEMESHLKKELKCDLIICLSHLGYEYETDAVSDTVLAENTSYTDIILGGHSHTILDKPEKKLNLEKRTVHIGQTGIYGIRLGRMDIWFNENKSQILVEGNTINISKNQAL